MIKKVNNVDNFRIPQLEAREDIVALQDAIIINIKEDVVEVAGKKILSLRF